MGWDMVAAKLTLSAALGVVGIDAGAGLRGVEGGVVKGGACAEKAGVDAALDDSLREVEAEPVVEEREGEGRGSVSPLSVDERLSREGRAEGRVSPPAPPKPAPTFPSLPPMPLPPLEVSDASSVADLARDTAGG